MSTSSAGANKVALPFKRVVIYKNGVAYFEREGKIEGSCSLDLYFKPSEMNDIIRSLRVSDLNGGKIANISYGSAISSNSSNGVPKSPSNTAVFGFLIGSNVRIFEQNDKQTTGRVLGTYESHDSTGKSQTVEILVDNSRVHFIDAKKIESVEIIDTHVTVSMKQNLDSLLNAKKQDKRQVSINCKGEGPRSIRVSYILENPIWKSNYRIFMKGGETKQFYLEGWACVDNTSEDDWNDVSLSLVSGSPISFQHEMYHPIIGQRPSQFFDDGKMAQNVTQVQKFAPPVANAVHSPINNYPSNLGNLQYELQRQAQRTQQHQAQLNSMQHMQQMNQMQQMQQMQQPMGMMGMGYGAAQQVLDPFGLEGSSLDLDTQTVEIGNLFHYEIQTPITVKKGHSSLVPTVTGTFKGRQICWFDPKRHAVNAMECIMLKNTLGSILDKGPVLVSEDNNYLGESIIENTLMQDEHKLLAYSVNLECKVTHKTNHSQTPKTTTIRYGNIKTIHTLTNNSEHEIELALDHEERVATKIEGAKTQADWKTGTRFYVMLPPLKKTIFTIPVVSTRSQINQDVLHTIKQDFVAWLNQGYLSVAAFNAIYKILLAGNEVAKAKLLFVAEKKREEQIIEDQRRVQGLAMTAHNETFMKQLSSLEGQLSQTRARLSQMYSDWKIKRDSCLSSVNELNFEINLTDVDSYAERVQVSQAAKVELNSASLNDLLNDQDRGKQMEQPAQLLL